MEAGAVDRTLLEGRGTELYETAVAEGGFAVDDPRIVVLSQPEDGFLAELAVGLAPCDID